MTVSFLRAAKKLAVAATFAGALAGSAIAQADDAAYDALLAKYVKTDPTGLNRVDYAAWAKSSEDRAKLETYITGLQSQTPSKMSRDAQWAYWANLYNSVTLKVVLDRYPVKSIRDIKGNGAKGLIGPWNVKRVTVEGKALSLDDIEHGIMRPTFKDPLVHYSVNCASIGCPNLKGTAWKAETLRTDLEEAARLFVNSSRGVNVTKSGVRVSSIYKWFEADFGSYPTGVFAHLKQYAGPDLSAKSSAQTKINGHSYDWKINATQ